MKVIGGNRLSLDAFSFVAHAEVVALDRVARKKLEWRIVLLQELQLVVSYIFFAAAARRRFRKLDNPLRLRIRQRPKHHAINNAENRSIRANTESQRNHRDSREAGAPGEHANGIPNILKQCVENRQT